MPEILGGLYSFGNRAKRQLRDLLSNPAAYLEQSAEKLRDEAGRPTSARRVAERALEPSEADIERSAAWWNPSPLGAMAGVVKQKGGNWLADSVEDALAGLKRETYGLIEPNAADLRDVEVNKWIEGPLTKYVKTRMATPEDEVRRLAEQGVLHFEPATIRERSPLMEKVVGRRETAGFPIQGVADMPLARGWENTTDSLIRNLEARDLSSAERAASFGGKSNIPADTIVHEMNPFASGAGISDVGFPHLIDELSNALNPQSGLPRHLQLTPEAMQNLSMEKAVRRVHDINEWRAAQKAEANRALAEKASVVREYAENNPKGLRWVELKHDPETPLPEGWSAHQDLKSGQTFYMDASGRKTGTPPTLEQQLKYEGDVMGHCGGGKRYCEGVLAGRTRIFSLRDAKGEPHVTVEVQPSGAHEAVMDAYPDMKIGSNKYKQAVEDYNERYPEEAIPKIIQIKGKGNRAPNEEYLPFVQDFVRNSPLGGQWSDVGDLANTRLLANKLHPSGFITREELEAAAKNPPEGYAPEDFIWPERYAQGGRVTPITIRPGTETATTGTRGRAEWVMFQE